MQRSPIPFGGSGLLLGTGTMATQPAALEDIRNVSLRPGRTTRRPGLFSAATLTGEVANAVIGVHPLRALGVTAVVGYDATSREVTLYLVAPDYTVREVGVIWTLDVGSPFPKVSLTDVWNKLIIAHDEPVYAKRKQTRYYEATPVENIFDIVAQLNVNSSGAQPVKFRGVTRYLTYLVGWGYGQEPSTVPPPDTEDNRPEVVRLSLPDDPLTFVPEHYFICGQRDDPVQGCWIAGDRLMARKSTESYAIFGSDRPSFGIVQTDSLFGVASSRLAVTVGAVNYFWAFDGPRRATGGASEDQAIPLDLANFGLSDPEPLEYDDAFAVYDPVERVVLFIFGALAFCWHTEVEQWTLRDYSPSLYAGGLFVRDGASSGLGPTGDTEFVAARFTTPTGAATTPGEVDVDVTGTLLGGEQIQVWGRPRGVSGAAWAIIGVQTSVVLGTNTVDVVWNKLGVTWDLATRLAISGVAGAAYRNSDPTAWPAPCQGSQQIALPVIASRTASFASCYFETRPATEADLGALVFFLDAPPITETHLTYELRQREIAGVFSAEVSVPALTAFGGTAVRFGIDAIRHTNREIEVRVKSPELTGAWVQIQASRWMGPLTYFGVTVDRETTGQYKWILTSPPEPVCSFDSGAPRLQFNTGSGYNDETFIFSFAPALVGPGFNNVVYTSALVSGRSNTEVAFRARREITWQGQLYYSIYFITAPT